MKKSLILLCLFVFVGSITPSTVMAGSHPKLITITSDSLNIDSLKLRLEEIAAIDKSDMSRVEKKKLKSEVRGIQHKLKEVDRGIYLSLGTVILIVILLIVLA
ncbi:MAG TPA: hypothetical protein PLH61_03410 [Bacteroidia bacterium]|nr:hypothetical protein [Bacteroidia bacterium]